MRLIFMGTPGFAVPALDALADAGHEIAAVYTRAPRPAGRGQRPRPSPVAARAAARGLALRTPRTLRDPDAREAFAAVGAEAAVVAAYGLILPQAVLDAPSRGVINIHASLLPRWRGAAPIARAILGGDAETGVSIMQVIERLDAGPVLTRRAVPIGPEDTAGDLHDRLAALGAEMVVAALADPGAFPPEPQDEAAVTYAAKIDKAEARVEWTRPAVELDRLIRGLSPFPGAWCEIAGERVKLLRSRLAEGAGPPGRALDDRLTVACGAGALRILELQRAGRAPAAAEAVLRGFPVPAGTVLG